jgi:hypothetical protein
MWRDSKNPVVLSRFMSLPFPERKKPQPMVTRTKSRTADCTWGRILAQAVESEWMFMKVV